jgi:hypothetical protein
MVYLIIFEDGKIRTTTELTEDLINGLDSLIVDIVNVTYPNNICFYVGKRNSVDKWAPVEKM